MTGARPLRHRRDDEPPATSRTRRRRNRRFCARVLSVLRARLLHRGTAVRLPRRATTLGRDGGAYRFPVKCAARRLLRSGRLGMTLIGKARSSNAVAECAASGVRQKSRRQAAPKAVASTSAQSVSLPSGPSASIAPRKSSSGIPPACRAWPAPPSIAGRARARRLARCRAASCTSLDHRPRSARHDDPTPQAPRPCCGLSGLTKRYGTRVALQRALAGAGARAASSRCSGPTAPASRRCSRC